MESTLEYIGTDAPNDGLVLLKMQNPAVTPLPPVNPSMGVLGDNMVGNLEALTGSKVPNLGGMLDQLEATLAPIIKSGAANKSVIPPSDQKITDATDLINKTVFLKVRFGSIGNARKVSGADVLTTDADLSLLKVSKTLLESPELDAIKKADGKMRTWLYNTCLPFDLGIMLLPVGLIEQAETRMQAYKAEREALIEAFIAVYPQLCHEAETKLGSLYREAEYPSVAEIRQRYTFTWNYTTFSVPGHLKNISAAFFEAEQKKAAETMKEASEEIIGLMRGTLYELVSHLQERLTPTDDGRPRILKESAIRNLNEFLDSFDLRNVTNDAELAAQVAKARTIISGTNAAQLRSNAELKSAVLQGLDGVLSSLDDLVKDKPGRKFRTE